MYPAGYTQTRAYLINKGSMNLYELVNSYGDKYESGGWCVFFCLPLHTWAFLTAAYDDGNFDVAATVAWLREV